MPCRRLDLAIAKIIRAAVGVAEARVLVPESSCSIIDLCERRCVSLIFVFDAPFVYRNVPVHVDAHVCARYQTSWLVDIWSERLIGLLHPDLFGLDPSLDLSWHMNIRRDCFLAPSCLVVMG